MNNPQSSNGRTCKCAGAAMKKPAKKMTTTETYKSPAEKRRHEMKETPSKKASERKKGNS
jgi:hypothetical protein